MAPTRVELEAELARQYGFEDYNAFREYFAAEFGKGMLRQLEAEMKRREKDTAGQ